MKKNTFIAVYGLQAGKLGNPLDAMDQDDGMDRNNVSTLSVSLGKIGKQEPFPEHVFEAAWKVYEAQIKTAPAARPIFRPKQYDKRIILRLPVEVASKATDPAEILKSVNVMDSAGGGLEIFGWDRNVESVTRERFYLDLKEQDKSRAWPGSASGWADTLDDVIHLVLGDKFGDAESLPLYLDEKNGIAYRPSISSRQQTNEFLDICITFNLLPEEITKRPPGPCGTLSHLLDFCRMFRWGVLERKEFVQLFKGQLRTSESAVEYEKFLRALMNIRIDFQNRGLRKDDILDAFPDGLKKHMGELLTEYYNVIESLNPRLEPTETHIEVCYSAMLRLNKEFYTAAYQSFGPCVMSLRSGD